MSFREIVVGFFVSGVLVLPGSAGQATPEFTADPATDFSAYSTYAWLPLPPGAGKSVEVRNPTAHKLIQTAVNRELSSKDVSMTRATPDLYVTYEVHRDPSGLNLSPAGYSVPSHFAERADLAPRVAGTLVVDLIDTKERKLVWRGWAEGAFTRAELLDYRTIERKVDGIVADVLAGFPPQPEQP
jgi:hypothetical protein